MQCLHADTSLPQNLNDDEPICQRTRTRMPMNHVSLDELDALLGNEDEGLFDEEGEQYEQFLRVSPLSQSVISPTPHSKLLAIAVPQLSSRLEVQVAVVPMVLLTAFVVNLEFNRSSFNCGAHKGNVN